MGTSARASAARTFVRILLLLAKTYDLALAVNRESTAEELRKAYRKLSLKTHPDKGGKKQDQQKQQKAKEAWEKVLLQTACGACLKNCFQDWVLHAKSKSFECLEEWVPVLPQSPMTASA